MLNVLTTGNITFIFHIRLEARSHRPDVELCRDPPHHRLVEEVKRNILVITSTRYLMLHFEVGQIQESIDLLNRKLNEAEMSHQVKIVSSIGNLEECSTKS